MFVLSVWLMSTVLVCSAQDVLPVSNSVSTPFPVKLVNTTNGACPSEERWNEARGQLTREVLTTLNLGLSQDYPASSCSALPANRPSDYYWILPASGPPAVQLYCDFNRQCGCDGPSTWTRVAFLNMSNPDHDCPSNWTTVTSEAPFRICGFGRGTPGGGCLSNFYTTLGISYSRVCGRITSYTQGSTEGLQALVIHGNTLEENYLDGISLTHGGNGSREHIWSFVSANGEVGIYSPQWVCDCSNVNQVWPYSTSFIGDDYFCDTGNHDSTFSNLFYPDDPLWDGEGCGPSSTCCDLNNPPWFCRALPRPTTDDLEVRICRGEGDSNSDTPVQLLELYVQ